MRSEFEDYCELCGVALIWLKLNLKVVVSSVRCYRVMYLR